MSLPNQEKSRGNVGIDWLLPRRKGRIEDCRLAGLQLQPFYLHSVAQARRVVCGNCFVVIL